MGVKGYFQLFFHILSYIRTFCQMNFIYRVYAVIQKDLLIESRSRYALNTVIAFVASASFLTVFSLDAINLTTNIYSGLTWIIILFAAMASLSRSFVMEAELKTYDLLRLNTDGIPVYTGKLLVNFLFTFLVAIFTLFIFTLFSGEFEHNIPAVVLVLLLGAIGFSGVATLLAALVSKADRKGAIFSVLCLPLMIPLIILLSDASGDVFTGASIADITEPIVGLIGFCGVTITVSVLLFEYIWND